MAIHIILRAAASLALAYSATGCARGTDLESRPTARGGEGSEPTSPGTSSTTGSGASHQGGAGGGGAAIGGNGGSSVGGEAGAAAGNGGSGEGGAAGAPATGCEVEPDCQGCGSCALAGDCADAYGECLANVQCSFYGSCRAGCATAVCIQGCQALYPLGVASHDLLSGCVCTACPSDCAQSSWSC